MNQTLFIASGSSLTGLLQYLVLFFILWLLYRMIKKISNIVPEAKSNWHHSFENIHFSSQQFYESIEAGIKQREIPSLEILRVTHK